MEGCRATKWSPPRRVTPQQRQLGERTKKERTKATVLERSIIYNIPIGESRSDEEVNLIHLGGIEDALFSRAYLFFPLSLRSFAQPFLILTRLILPLHSRFCRTG